MDVLNWIFLAVAAVSLGFACFIYRRERRTLSNLSAMLDKAIGDAFAENAFDESMLSAIEVKMAKFLASCAVSSKNLRDEKNKIKALISDISHQTKTPIANIVLYTQLLREADLPPDCADQVKILSVQEVISTATVQAQAKAEAKSIRIITEDTAVTALFDAKWTAEAIYNILDNAVKYSPRGSRVTVKATAYDLFCRIDIADEGMGICEEEHSKVFGRFYRSPAVAEQEGVGIGLYLAREIIAANGGYIKVSSQPGRGAMFSIFLPLEGP